MKDDTQKFGTVTFNGVTFILRDQPEYTSRLLPAENYMDRATNGGAFRFEMSAPALSPSGEECEVFWVFLGKEDRDPDSYDFDSVDRVEF